jgi:hypothetical protein
LPERRRTCKKQKNSLPRVIYPTGPNQFAAWNVALFHPAARVESIKIPADTTFEVQLEMRDGAEPSYTVWMQSPAIKPEPPARPLLDPLRILMLAFYRVDPDDRVPSLRINPLTIHVHHVAGVTVNAESHLVDRFEAQR